MARFAGTPGLNMHEVSGIQLGQQTVQLVGSDGSVIGTGSGVVDVTDSISGTGNICNFNYQVVHIA